MHIFQPELTQKSYFSATIVHAELICSVCIYVQYTDILFTYKVPEANTHVPHHTHKGKMILPMVAAPQAPPPSVLSRFPFVCGVNGGDVLNLYNLKNL